MADEATRSRNPAGHAGLLDNLLALASALAGFFESRFALFSKESKAALVQMLGLGRLSDRRCDARRDWIYFSHRKRGRRPGAPRSGLVAVGDDGGGRDAFPHRAGSPPGRAQPHDEAALSRNGI